MFSFKVIKIFLLMSALSMLIIGCASSKKLIINGIEINQTELCSDLSTRCAPDGEFTTIFEADRPILRNDHVSIIDASKDYLGRTTPLWSTPANIAVGVSGKGRVDTEKCITLTSEDVSIVFNQTLNINTVDTEKLRRNLSINLDNSLSLLPIKNKLQLSNKIAHKIAGNLKESSSLNSKYQIISVNRDVLDEINRGSTEEYKACKEKLSSGDHFLIRSIAIISSHGLLSGGDISSIKSSIKAILKVTELENNVDISDSVIASISSEISALTERAVNTSTDYHSTVYGYGYWEPNFIKVDNQPNYLNFNPKYSDEFVITGLGGFLLGLLISLGM